MAGKYMNNTGNPATKLFSSLKNLEFVQEIDLFEKQLGINCASEQIGLF